MGSKLRTRQALRTAYRRAAVWGFDPLQTIAALRIGRMVMAERRDFNRQHSRSASAGEFQLGRRIRSTLMALLVEVGSGLGVRIRDRVQGSRHRWSCSTTSTVRRSLRWWTVVAWPRRCLDLMVCA